MHFGSFPPLFTRKTTFATSCLLSFNDIQLPKKGLLPVRVYPYQKENKSNFEIVAPISEPVSLSLCHAE